jgi:MFS family permease
MVEEDKKSNSLHYPSLICIMSIGFIANCEYGVVMPSIWSYLQSIGGSESQLGFALSASSFAQLCFLPVFGFWSDKRTMREVITISMVIGIAGNVLYALAGYFQSPYCIIAGRALTGIYMGVISVTNSYVALVTTPETRTRFMAQLNGINAIGMVSGPGFNVFLNMINFKIGAVPFDSKTNPGWFIAVLVFLSCIAFFIFFREPKAPAAKRHDVSTNAEYKTIGSFKQQKISGKQYMWFILTAFMKPYGACFIICFVQNFDFSVLETIATVLTSNFYNFDAFKNSLFYSALSLEMVVIIFITAAASRMGAQDRILLLIAQAFVGAGSIGMLIFYTRPHVDFWKFCLFAALLIAGIPSQNISVMSTYSKLLTAEFGQAKQGLYTGIIMLFGSLARILGPLWGGSCMEANKLVLLFGLLVGMWAFDVLFTLSFYRKLKPAAPVDPNERVSLLAH